MIGKGLALAGPFCLGSLAWGIADPCHANANLPIGPIPLANCMRLILLTSLTMIAFAANSLLNRGGVELGGMDPLVFAAIRVAAGAGVLALLSWVRSGTALQGGSAQKRIGSALALTLYLLGFSFAYQSLDAGLGALILFGVVQLVMFAWAISTGPLPSRRRMIGAGIAFAGLVLLLAPGQSATISLIGVTFMVCAGVGWGVYSLIGQTSSDPLGETAANFMYSVPLVLIVAVIWGQNWAWNGAIWAIISGGLTSGLGYALWYQILPKLGSVRGAMAQLTVPPLAVLGGILLFSEPFTWSLAIAGGLVIGGLGLGIERRR